MRGLALGPGGLDDLLEPAVHIGARVAATAQPNEVWVTGTVKDILVGSELSFAPRGTHDLKGVPGEWPLFSLAGPSAAP